MWTGNEALSKCEVRSRGRRPRRTEHLESAEFTVAFSESFLCEIFGNRGSRLMRPWCTRSQSKTHWNNLFFLFKHALVSKVCAFCLLFESRSSPISCRNVLKHSLEYGHRAPSPPPHILAHSDWIRWRQIALEWIFENDELQHKGYQHVKGRCRFRWAAAPRHQYPLIQGQYPHTAARYLHLLQILGNRLWIPTDPRFESLWN